MKKTVLSEQLQKTVVQNGLIPKGSHVLLALSGGPDSMALLCGLVSLSKELDFALSAAHFHHGIRKNADADEAFCRAWCETSGIPFYCGRGDVPTLAEETGQTLEQAAREARYAFLKKTAETIGAQRIAVAHHRDDQAETVLFRLGRGSGLKGLTGMALKNGDIIRPMLCVSRADVLSFLKENHIPFCKDETNDALCCARNRIRALLPELEAVHAGFSRNVCRAAELLRQDEEALTLWAQRELHERLTKQGLSAEGLSRLPAAVKSRVLRLFCAREGIACDLELCHIEALFALLERQRGKTSLPKDREAVLEQGRLCIRSCQKEEGEAQEFCIPLAEGVWEVPQGRLTVRRVPRPEKTDEFWPMGCYLSPAVCTGAKIRTRRAGDVIRPLGAPGSKKLKDLYIDKKIPKAQRRYPVVACESEVLFAAGAGFSARAALTQSDSEAICVLFEPHTEQN